MTTIAEALDELVRPDKTVAEVLLEARCHGKHGSRECPVALFLLRTTGLDVYTGQVHVHERVKDWEWQEFLLPDAVRKFVAEFDAGYHPELDNLEVVSDV